MLYSDRCRLQEIVDFQLVIDSHWWWIWYISWVIDLRFVDHAALKLMPASSLACQTALAAVWCRSFDSDRSLDLGIDFDSQLQSSYQDNDESDWDSWFESASWFDS